MSKEWEAIGNNDLRMQYEPESGFHHVTLRDADDGDVIVINEDDIETLRDRLSQILESMK
jgi:vacuolar-type H+-ATPase subunit F/Vma7